LISSVLLRPANKAKRREGKMKEYKIRVKNEIVTVSKEIYTAYYKMRRRERYIEEISIKNNLSYDQLVELDYTI
jgi:hypothetical protein